jgi:hypothetical protein
MTTDDTPTGYPSSWHPSWAPEQEAPQPDTTKVEPLAAEVWLASLDDDELDATMRRVRDYRGRS